MQVNLVKKLILGIVTVSTLIVLFAAAGEAQDSLFLLAELWGEEEGDYFMICGSAGDVNADGFTDIVVGASQGMFDEPGYVKIFFGGEDFDTVPDLKMVGEDKSPIGRFSGFGASVACAGDVNGDGYDDVIVGAPFAFNYDNWTWDAGKAYIYFGGNPMDTTADVILQDSDYKYYYGTSVSSAGDVNGDGYDDVVVGTPNYHLDDRGRACIYFGGESMDNILDVYVEGEATFDKAEELGTSVAGIGDINGDGYDDVLIGAPNPGGWPLVNGRASIYFGGDPMDTTADLTFHGDSIEFVTLGRVVASVGDVNGDGVKDIALSGVSERVRLFHRVSGNPGLEFDSLTLAGEDLLPSAFGLSISTAGDLNSDGFDDVLVSDYQCGNELKGKAYIFYGGNEMDSLFDLTLTGDDLPGARFGYRVGFAGDINGDGGNELVVSSYGDNTRIGKVFIYTSRPTSIDENNKNLNPESFFLGQNYPNPFNPSTTIPFTVYSEQSTVNSSIHTTLIIYNILGQRVRTLMNEKRSKGYYEIVWDGRNHSGKVVASGIYFYQVRTGAYSETKRMLLLK